MTSQPPAPISSAIDALLQTLDELPVTDHAGVYAQAHTILQDALADVGAAPDRH